MHVFPTNQCIHVETQQMIKKITAHNRSIITAMYNADAKKILTASLLEEWKRPPGCLQITVLYDRKLHKLTETVNTAQNRPLWKLLATSGSTQSDGASWFNV